MEKTCENCNFCLLADYGYSNYTTEGTEVICLKDQQPDFDRFYGEDPRLKFAESCPMYEDGHAFEMDTDQTFVMDFPNTRADIVTLIKNRLGLE